MVSADVKSDEGKTQGNQDGLEGRDSSAVQHSPFVPLSFSIVGLSEFFNIMHSGGRFQVMSPAPLPLSAECGKYITKSLSVIATPT